MSQLWSSHLESESRERFGEQSMRDGLDPRRPVPHRVSRSPALFASGKNRQKIVS